MKQAPKGKEFQFCNGDSAKSFGQFVNLVKKLSPDEFSHHVNADRNDFHNWLGECISADVAESIREASSHRDVVEKLSGHAWEENHKRKFDY
ncbi:MAG: hypothetical protein ACLFPQ_06680 [Candidatus Woesearchaeota archaeon]